MHRVTKEELERMEIRSNKVLLRPLRETSNERYAGVNRNLVEKVICRDTENEARIWIDCTYNVGQHAPVFCEVIKVPKRLDPKRMEWETDMELQVGDKVVASYMSISNALALEHESVDDDMIVCGKDIYCYIEYEYLYVAKRGDEIIPLNGYVLCEPVTKNVNELDGLIRIDKEDMSEHFARVKYVGSELRSYKSPDLKEFSDSKAPVKEGDLIAFDRACDIPIEFGMHAEMMGGKTFFRIQRCYMKAIVPEGILE